MRISASILLLIFATGVHSFAQSTKSQCPKFTVIGPPGITIAGDDVFFTLEFEGDVDLSKSEPEWAVENGTIIEGQGTNRIRVVSKIPGANVKAVITINGLRQGCAGEASEIAPIADIPFGQPVDRYGDLSVGDELSRLDTFFAELGNKPTSIGFITISVGESGNLERGKKRVSRIIEHAKFREFDKGRLIFRITKGDENRTTLWRVPEHAEMPPCGECEILKGRFQ